MPLYQRAPQPLAQLQPHARVTLRRVRTLIQPPAIAVFNHGLLPATILMRNHLRPGTAQSPVSKTLKMLNLEPFCKKDTAAA